MPEYNEYFPGEYIETTNPLPKEAILLNTFTVEYEDVKIPLPLYEYPINKDGHTETYHYLLGWPKDFLAPELKAIVQTSLYWDNKEMFEDEQNYYYDLKRSRQSEESIPKEEINKRVEFIWKQAQNAYRYLSRLK